MMEGTIELQVAGAPVTLAAGEFVYIPGGTLHAFKVNTPTARFLSINSARGASEFFGEVSREVGDHGISGPTPPPKHT